jgi:hypothetical protein
MLLIFFKKGSFRINKKVGFVLFFFILHTVLFGLVFVNDYIKNESFDHFRQLIETYLFALFTADYIYRKKCRLEFLQLTYIAYIILLAWSAITHRQDIVNPMYYINIFSKAERFRTGFGMVDVNVCGHYCAYAIVTCIFMYKEWRDNQIRRSLQLHLSIFVANLLVICMLFSTASRSAILSLLLFIFMYCLLNLKKIIGKFSKPTYLILLILAMTGLLYAILGGVFSNLLGDSNREMNWTVNYPIFDSIGNIWTGMGYMDNSGFQIQSYGFATVDVDVYYLYLFFTTGIIGCALLIVPVIYIIGNLIHHRNNNVGKITLSLFIMMLFYTIWQVNFFNYRFLTGVINIILVLLALYSMNEVRRSTKQNCIMRRH